MTADIRIIDLRPDNLRAITETASLLFRGFREHNPNGWPDMDAALQEVKESFQKDRISRIAINSNGSVLGWIGGIGKYQGHVWELHPLVIDPDYQRQGIGRALIEDFEKQVKERGGKTVWLGADDEDNMTSIAGIDLYPDVLGHLAKITNLKGHPYEFYQKMGYVIIGALPDADGPGKPDIFMAKSVKR
jgi:aminoglycoside 6'-N-acetyltransferase I